MAHDRPRGKPGPFDYFKLHAIFFKKGGSQEDVTSYLFAGRTFD